MQERKEKIIQLLRKQKSVRIIDLSKELKVSRETIRKDITDLEKEGLLKKTYGGAILDEANMETDYMRRRTENQLEKEAIAKCALRYIEEGDSIYLDYGTSTYALAKELVAFDNLTVVTNSIPIVNLLIHSPGINLIILGGNIRKNEDSLFGSFGLGNAERIFVDVGFFGCAGVNPKAGLTNYHMGEIEISSAMIKHSSTAVLLADETKIGKIALYKTSDMVDLDIIITTNLDDLDLIQEINERGVKLVSLDLSN